MSYWVKTTTLETIKDFLLKARRRLSDENPDFSDTDDEANLLDDDTSSDETEMDNADQWLAAQKKPDAQPEEGELPLEDETVDSEAVSPDKTEETPEPEVAQKLMAKPPTVRKPMASTAAPSAQPTSDDELQPSREELSQMREYTRPWEQRARDKSKLEAEPTVNPINHHQGHLIEARNTSHIDRQRAQEALTNSPEYQNADPITQMEMDSRFHDDWHKHNPEHLMNALKAHHEAHKKSGQTMQAYSQAKDEKIRHIAGGGAQPGAMSLEEGVQHAGGSREDEDSGPSGIRQDKGAAFASGNQDFLQQYMKNYDKKAKKYSDVSDMDQFDPETRADVSSVLGDHPALKDPSKKRQVDRFVGKYHPLIGKATRHVLSKLGLTDKANSGEIDPGLLHEAGVHALFQAVNDYDHDHPSKAKFTTHLNRKMHGLMQSALKTQQAEVPDALRTGAKQFDKQRRAENAAPVKHTNKEGVTTIINPPKRSVAEIATTSHPDVQDRLKRVVAARAPVVRKQATVQPKPAGPKISRTIIPGEDGDE